MPEKEPEKNSDKKETPKYYKNERGEYIKIEDGKTKPARIAEIKLLMQNKLPFTTRIQETKCSCSACGNIWFYGKQDVSKASADEAGNLAKTCFGCGTGCWPALFIPDAKVTDFDKCPKCGSRSIKKEVVIHNV